MAGRRCSAAGFVGVEYLIIIGPVLMFFFCTFQLYLLHVGRHLCHHAAVVATRAAVVVLDDDPARYGGEARNDLAAGGQRHADILAAARVPLLPAVPGWETTLSRHDRYLKAAVAVSFPSEPGGRESKTQFGLNEDVTVRTTFLYECVIPMARYIVCDSLEGLREDAELAEELDRVEDVGAQWEMASRGARYNVFRAETTLPNQGSRYAYAGGSP